MALPRTKLVNDKRWKRVDDILGELLEKEPPDRDAFLEIACRGDDSLKHEVLSLLDSQKLSGSFLETPAVEQVADVLVTKEGKLKKGHVIGQYRTVRELGTGGQGTVYEAVDTKLNRTVALKMLPNELAVNGTALKRFRREAQLASSLDHPNICTIHDLIESEGRHFIVMQYVAGQSIRDLVGGHPLELKSSVKIAIQVCDAVAAAHSQGIIHRDIKAQNIIVNDSGQAKILDFGLAKLYSSENGSAEQTELTAFGSPYGTPTYAAPEQSRGEAVDHRADIFSTGVLLYEMLTGTWAFHGKTSVDVRHAVLHDEPLPVSERRGDGIPAKLQQIIDTALKKDPGQRFQSMAEMRDSLIDVFREQPDSETSETARFLDNFKPIAPSRLLRWRRGPFIAASLAAILLIGVGVSAGLWFRGGLLSSKTIRSIAVLPFKPLGEQKDEFLEFGMADALISRISRVKELAVRPTGSVLKFAGRQDAAVVGRELGVDAVFDGRIQREGDKLRVTVELIRVSDGVVMWFGKFDEDFKGIFAVQDSISERVFNELSLTLSEQERQQVTKRQTENTAAYQSYLRGRYFWNKFSGQAADKAIENFEQSIKEDPNYAPAYAGLADAYELQGYLNIKPVHEVYPLAQAAVSRALAIDDQLGEAHLVQAKINLFYDWNLNQAESEIGKALALAPNNPDAHGFYGVYLVVTGQLDPGLVQRLKAQELDPTSAFAAIGVGWSYFYKHDFDNAIAQYRKALELDPNFSPAYESIGTTLLRKGNDSEAVEAYMKEKALQGVPADRIATFQEAFGAGGIRGYWQKELESSLERAKQGKPASRRIARIYTELGDRDRAFEWLDRSFEEHNTLMIFLRTDPTFDRLRDDPRMQDLIRRMGLVN